MEPVRRILGVDYGRRRVGIAVSDPLGIIARGVTVLERTGTLAADICRIAAEFDAVTVVVGMPLTLRGEKGPIALEVEEFIAARAHLRTPSSQSTSDSPRRRPGRRSPDGRADEEAPGEEDIDRMAAALILQTISITGVPRTPRHSIPAP